MKKILVLALACLFTGTLCTFAINFSLSDGGFGLNADVVKEGNNVRLKYKIKGMNQVSNVTDISDEQKETLSGVGDVDFDILASCSEPKVKILSMTIYGTNGKLMSTLSDTDWVTMEEPDDIAKLKEICNKL